MVAGKEDNAFGRLLTSLRESKSLTKAQVAANAGLDASSISRLESGERNPEPHTVEAVARGLDLNPVDKERLLATAGFRSQAWDDPFLVALVELLLDPDLPGDVRTEIRTLIKVAVSYGTSRSAARD
jgi:transcriptional regulator with XRE-family HTH domain